MLSKTNLYLLLYLVLYPVYATLSSSSVIQRASLSNDQQPQLGNRQTKAMDLSDFNEFLSQTTLYIPDMLVEEGVPNNAKIKIENFYCSDLSIKKITDVSQEVSNKRTKYTIDISGLEIFCRIKWTYFKGFFTEDVGGARFFAKNSDLQVVLDVMSDPFITNTETNDVSFYPTRTEQRDCNAKVNIQDMDFWGGIRAGVLNLLENSLQESFGKLIEDEICGQVESELTDALNEPLRKVIDQIEPYLNDLQLINIDPLSAQKELVLPEGADVLNFESSESFKKVVDYVNRFLGDVVEDPNNNFGGEDLGINVLIRSNFLDDNRAYSISMEMFDNLVQGSNSTSEEIEVGDNMVQIQSELVSLSIIGLDSFSSFVPLNPIGPQTLYNNFALKKLQLETKFQLHFSHTRHTRNDDFYIEIKKHSENFTAVTGIRNIDTSFSFLSALDFGRMNKLQVYNFVNQDHYQPCFRSITYGFNWTQLEIWINNFDSPVVENLFSPGIDSFASSVAETISDLYGDAFQSVIPNYLGTKTRAILNRISEEKWQDEENNFCPTYDSTLDSNGSRKKYIDFRDLLLDPTESLVAGGSGESPYGNITHKLFDAMTDYITKDKDGSPNVNRQIRLITNGQSGTPGTWILSNSSTPLLNTTIPFASVDMLNISLLETRLENLDSFGYPLELLQPKPGRAHVVDNHVVLGVGSRPFRLSGNVEVQTESLYTNGTSNIVFQLEMPNIQLLFSILARMTESLLMEIPYTELDNIYCWIATIPASELDEYGMLVDYTEEDYASVFNFDVLAGDFKFNAECHGCTLSGMNELPQIFKLLNDIGVSHTATRKILQNVQSKVQQTGLRSELSRIITDAQKRCPLHVEYIADFNGTEYKLLPDEPVTKQEAETMVLIGTIMAQVAMVVGSISTPDTDMTDNSLSAQVSIDNVEDVQLIDFINHRTTTDRLIETFFSSVNTMLGSLREDLTSSSGYTLGINSIVKSNILDEDGSFSFSLNTTLTDNILLESTKIKGLDSFIAFDGIDPIAAQTMQSKMKLEHLKIELNMVLNTTSVGDDAGLFDRGENRMLRADNMQTSESMIISVEMQNIEINVALLLGLIEDKLGGLQLGTLFNTDQILSCVLSSIYDIDITQLKVSVGSLSGLDVEGFLSDDIREAIILASESIVSEYGSDLRSAIPVLFDSVVRGLLNDEVKSYLSDTTCFPYEAPIDDRYIDFRDLFLNASEAAALGGSGEMPYGDLLSMLMEYVHTELIAPNDEGAPSINDKLIEPLTLSSSNETGTIHIPGDVISKTIFLNESASSDDMIVVQVKDVSFENLNTISYPVQFLHPQDSEPYVLENRMVIGSEINPLRLSSRVVLALQGDTSNLFNDFIIELELRNADAFIPLFLKVREALLLNIPLDDITNPFCWFASIPAPELNRFGLRDVDEEIYAKFLDLMFLVSDLQLNIDCVNCSSPGLLELGFFFTTSEGKEKSTMFGENLLNFTRNFFVGDYGQSEIDRFLNDAVGKCPHRKSEFSSVKYDKLSIAGVTTNASQVTLAICGFVAVFFVLVTTVNQFIKKRERIKHKRWLKTLSHEDIANLYAKQLYADKKEHSQKVHTKSIFFSGVVPLFVRILMPCVILVNIGLFLSGHLSLGGTVLLDIIFAGEEVRIQNFFEFAIAETVRDMWVEGLYALAVILFICSVIWPYIKQLILLVLWFTPPSLVSTTRRGKIFLSLDSLGKWSIIDIYVLMITLVVFRITVQSPNSSNSLAQTFYGLELLLLPMWGLYANMIAQLVSQVSSHFIIYYHRKIVKEGTLKFLSQEALRVTNSDDLCDMPIDVIPDNTNGAAEQLDPLSEHTYVEGTHKNDGKMKVKRSWNIFILCWGITTILFLILGCSIPSLRLEVMGMAGKLIAAGSGPESLVQYHSVFTMIGVIMGEARYLASTSHYIGLGVLCTLLVGTSFFVPIAMSVLLLFIWFRPMTRKVRKRLVLTCEVLGAWQFVEVYIIAAFLGMWQIGDVTETMVKDFCKPLDSAFGSLAHFGILSEKDARCFYAFAILELGCYILIAASPMLSGLTYMILKAEKQQMTNLNDLMDKKKAKGIPTMPMSQDAEKTVHKLYKNIRPIPVQFTDIFKMMLCAKEEKSPGETVPLNALLSHDTSLLLKEENQAIVPEKDDKSDNISAPTAVPLHLS